MRPAAQKNCLYSTSPLLYDKYPMDLWLWLNEAQNSAFLIAFLLFLGTLPHHTPKINLNQPQNPSFYDSRYFLRTLLNKYNCCQKPNLFGVFFRKQPHHPAPLPAFLMYRLIVASKTRIRSMSCIMHASLPLFVAHCIFSATSAENLSCA